MFETNHLFLNISQQIHCPYLIKIVDMCTDGSLAYSPSVLQSVIKVCAEDTKECKRYFDYKSAITPQNRLGGR